ncbi:MAG: glycosyltransferase family 2 protein [Acidobacteriota bacterium]
MSRPRLSAVVVHWRNETELERLVAAWPADDPRFEMIVVDNSGSLETTPPWVVRLDPKSNLGFGGGVEAGRARARGEAILVLNPDAAPEPGALEILLDGLDRHPDAAGLVPALFDDEGRSQHRWQLAPLPTATTLIGHTLFVGTSGFAEPPPAGAPIPQPAAAALLLRTRALEAIGGFDEGYFPAWFEDVDLARRLATAGEELIYLPAARFRHHGGASVPRLGYGPFLWVYYRNLQRYLRVHHGRLWVWVSTLTMVAGMKLRLALLPVRRPALTRDRASAARGLVAVISGVLSGWRLPGDLARRFAGVEKKR